MCGIAGIVCGNPEHYIDEVVVRHMCNQITHRGPDEEGLYVVRGAGLGMRRLSIIDLAGGRQPIFNEARSAWVVFNGEVYNFPTLRSELESRGHRFYTNTDTEVIIHLYEELGADCIKQLRGMFALAIYDKLQRKLILARDRLGKKPLHYAFHGGNLYFGSEIKAILAVVPELAEVSAEATLQYLYLGYVPDPMTVFRGIRKLPPGHLLEFSEGNLQVRRFWDVPKYDTHFPKTEDECLEELEWRLLEATRMRLISDVPLGAFLSGGVDSSTVVAMMARTSSEQVKTFSIAFSKQEFNEAHYARMVAKKFHTEHHEMLLEPEVAQTIQLLTSSLEEPFGDSSMLPTYYVSQMARKHVKVVLSGDGGDEMFAGYDRYRIQHRRHWCDRVPEWARRFYRNYIFPRLPRAIRQRKFSYNVSLSWQERYIDALSFIPAFERETPLLSDGLRDILRHSNDPCDVLRCCFRESSINQPLSQMLYVDSKTYLVADILTKVDRMSMLNSLEVRVPLLDHHVVEWAVSLSSKWKLRGRQQKYILLKLAERLGVPPEALYRKKHGFEVPLDHWMRHDLKDMLMVLTEPRSLQRGYFQPGTILTLVDDYLRLGRASSGRLWRLLMFELWHRNFLEKSICPAGLFSLRAS